MSSTEITTVATDTPAMQPVPPAHGSIDELRQLGHWLALAESGGDGPAEKGAAAALRFYFARELGLPPLAAAELSVIRGRLSVGSKLLRALAARHGYRVVRDPKSDAKSCTARLIHLRTGEVVGEYTFTIDDATRAKLVKSGSAWETHPARMLWQRASKFVLDDYAPEVTLGIVSDDETAEIADAGDAPDWVDVDATSQAQMEADYLEQPDEPDIEWPGAPPA